jgi:D-glycero-alpha-D-manno-heptose 1-phosphate guanylyltransferase
MQTPCPIIILAGGFGTRLRSVDSTRPKPMVLVREKPFLYWLIFHLTRQGFTEFILSTGYMAEQIETYSWHDDFAHCRFSFVREDQPLGTGGAVLKVFRTQSLKSAWVINGDTLVPSPLPDKLNPAAWATYTGLAPENIYDAAPNLHVRENKVTEIRQGGALFDAGQVHVTDDALRLYQGPIPCNLHQVLAPAMAQGRVECEKVEGVCYDIGTPERLRRFEDFLLLLKPV